MINKDLNSYRILAGLSPVSGDDLTEAVMHQDKAKKKKVKKANLTEKGDMKAKAEACRDIAKGNKKATAAGKMKKKVMKEAIEHFGDKDVAKQVTEAILWKKLAKVEPTLTEQELAGYFKEFDTLLETVVDTQMGAKSLHGQYDKALDGNVYKDSDKEANAAVSAGEKGASMQKGESEKWRKANEKATSENVKKVTEDSEGAKKAEEAASKSDAGGAAKDAIAKGSHGKKTEGFDLEYFRKVAGITEKEDTTEMHMVVETATGNIQCMFPKYEEASKWLERMKKAAGKQGYHIDSRKFSKGFHYKQDTNGGYSSEAK